MACHIVYLLIAVTDLMSKSNVNITKECLIKILISKYARNMLKGTSLEVLLI